MKTIKLTDYETFKTRDVVKQIIEAVPPSSGGLSLGAMRSRLKLLDKLDGANGKLELEDAEHQTLVGLLSTFPFGVVHPDLVKIADAIENAT